MALQHQLKVQNLITEVRSGWVRLPVCGSLGAAPGAQFLSTCRLTKTSYVPIYSDRSGTGITALRHSCSPSENWKTQVTTSSPHSTEGIRQGSEN